MEASVGYSDSVSNFQIAPNIKIAVPSVQFCGLQSTFKDYWPLGFDPSINCYELVFGVDGCVPFDL